MQLVPQQTARVLLLILGLAVANDLAAQTESEQVGFRQHGAHVHGAATLSLALDGQDMEVDLSSPAMNVVGFEHLPSTAEQKQQVQAAAELLRHVNKILDLPKAAGCTQTSVQLRSALLGDKPDEPGHADFDVTYQLNCTAPEQLNTLAVKLFQNHPGLHRIQVQWIVGEQQGALALSPDNASFKLSP